MIDGEMVWTGWPCRARRSAVFAAATNAEVREPGPGQQRRRGKEDLLSASCRGVT